ncbi:MAG: DegT/DnrJ/EryC1/StrS family aminotransferase [Limisphaerales bacterium]
MNPSTTDKVPFVDLYTQYLHLQPEMDEAIQSVIRESAYVRGRQVEAFEKSWADLLGIEHCVSCANGTDALYIAMRGLGLKPGDEVITTAHSWISTTETITQAGGRVVFVDTDETFTLDPAQIEARITPRTVGLIPVHLYGQPADMEPIMALAKKHGLWVIEDCAQAHLARYRGQLVGTFGHAATFSFYPGKNLGAYGDAGCVVTRDAKLADWMSLYARHGGKGDHVMEGINSRLDGIQAAVLNVKMKHLPRWNEQRRAAAARYDAALAGVTGVTTPTTAPGREHVYHLYVLRSPRRDHIRKELKERHVDTVVNYPKALPFYPAYAYLQHQPADFPIAHRNQSEIVSIPIYPEITQEQTQRVAQAVIESLRA